MHRLTPMTTTHLKTKHQRGIALIESLVAIVITALGILGILGVQMRTLADTQTGVRRAQAIRLTEDLSERTKVNPSALANIAQYVQGFGAAGTPPTDCKSSACDSVQLAQYDVAIWKQAVANTLPLGDAAVFISADEATPGNQRQLGVMISWRENERDTTAAAVFTPDSTGAAGISCPANRICHLQYIQLNSRCAIYTYGGPGANRYFCPSAQNDLT